MLSRRSDAPRVAFLVAVALGVLAVDLVARDAWERSRMGEQWGGTTALVVWTIIAAACGVRVVATLWREAPHRHHAMIAAQGVITAGWASQLVVAAQARASVGSIVFGALCAQSVVGLLVDRRAGG